MKKTPQTLVSDIYRLLETKEFPEGVDLREECDRFGKEMAEVMYDNLQPDEDRSGKLRLSAIGKPMRQLYNSFHGVAGETLRGPTYIKFLYGHLIESMLLSLVRMSGHEVTEQQKQVEVEGVKGHQDCRIDGVLCDVKSCSSYSFKKFRNHQLHTDDPFGYIAQLKAYAHHEGDTTYGWLAMDKQNGTLAWLQYDETDTGSHYYDAVNWDVVERVQEIKKAMGADELPSVCYEPVPDGKSGNLKLASGCAYCQFKHTCWPEMRTFSYASGPRYLVKVEREPRALEVPDDF
jgi:hypothetical protein